MRTVDAERPAPFRRLLSTTTDGRNDERRDDSADEHPVGTPDDERDGTDDGRANTTDWQAVDGQGMGGAYDPAAPDERDTGRGLYRKSRGRGRRWRSCTAGRYTGWYCGESGSTRPRTGPSRWRRRY